MSERDIESIRAAFEAFNHGGADVVEQNAAVFTDRAQALES